jgi:ABC-type antimicrobial peptide transport system permease subunit
MRLSDTFIAATQNLGRRKVRTILTSIGVFVGILTVVTMVSLGVGIQQQVTDTIKQLGLQTVFVTPRISGGQNGAPNVNVAGTGRIRPTVPLNNEAVEKIAQVSGVISVEVMLSLPTPPGMTVTIDGKTLPLSLADRSPQANLFEAPTTFVAGGALPGSADARGLVLSTRVLQSAGYAQADVPSLLGKQATITVTAPRGEQQTFDTTVVGISEGFNPAQLGNADKLAIKEWWYNDPNILETDGYSAAIVHTDSLNSATNVSKTIQGDMGFDSATLQTFLDQVNRIFSILQVMLSSIGLLALFVASIGIVNTMIMAIYERTREIGILKALGSSNGEILRMFMIEAGLIGLLGGIVGVILGWGLGIVLNAVIRNYFKSQQVPIDAPFFVVTPELVIAALLFATLVGVAAGLYPSFRAARLNPLTALRHE